MTDEEKNEDPKIFVDEDWKQKAEAEKKALEEELASQAEESAEAPAEGEYDLPPASFPSLLQEFSTRALVSLGMIQNPFSGEAQVDLKAAAYSIDMLAILQEKTEGNLEESESAYLGQLIAQLREAFLKVSAAGGGAEAIPMSPELFRAHFMEWTRSGDVDRRLHLHAPQGSMGGR
ncbi:MAG: DUF1844 domain-containing protein, partial [Planctomycetes bacterium]|nr:DUF1844 domain-containing protein [Planctomycetota bacterium]